MPNNLDQNALATTTVELGVVDLLPRPKIQLAIRNRDHNLTSHDLSLEMHISIVFTGVIMTVVGCRFMWRQLFEPVIVILDEAGFIIIDIYTGRNMHCVDQADTLFNIAVLNQVVLSPG